MSSKETTMASTNDELFARPILRDAKTDKMASSSNAVGYV